MRDPVEMLMDVCPHLATLPRRTALDGWCGGWSWRSLKHRWLFLHELDSLAAVAGLVVFYVQQHNEVVPHSAFRGHTPDEMCFGTSTELVAGLDEVRRAARGDRIRANQSTRCGVCPRVDGRPPGGAGE